MRKTDCSGCGVCAAVKDSRITVRFDEYGMYQPDKSLNDKENRVCPFSNDSLNEDHIAQKLFSGKYKKWIGYYQQCYAGHVLEDSFRSNGSSGGFGSWLLKELIEKKLVDKVIHVKESKGNSLFKYQISSSVEEIKTGSKSRYYPVELSEVLKYVRKNNHRYAIVGIACFIKALRLLELSDPIIRKRIKYHIGLVCGPLKSTRFADYYAWQIGINPGKLRSIDFRDKSNSNNSLNYSTKFTGMINGKSRTVTIPNKNLIGSNWGHGLFKYPSCDFCDDVFAETADVTLGDAWLPEYMNDPQGTNIIIIRNNKIYNIIKRAKKENRIKIEELAPEQIIKSQDAGIRHKNEGLAYRLYLNRKSSRIKKRVKPGKPKEIFYHIIFRYRMFLSKKSHELFLKSKEKNDINYISKRLKFYILSYKIIYRLFRIKKRLLHA